MARTERLILFSIILCAIPTHAILHAHVESVSLNDRVVMTLQRRGIPQEFIVVLVSALPILELRGGIPLSVYTFDMSYRKSYMLAVFGNLIPVIPLLLFLTSIAKLVSRYEPLGGLLNWFFGLTRRRGGLIEKYEALGLILFVAIPLPVTGAWTGAVASVLFGLRFRYALPSIGAGVSIAGVIVSAACWFGINLFS